MLTWWRRQWVLLKVLLKYAGLVLWQKSYLPVVSVRRNVYEVQYALKDRIYKVRTRIRRPPMVARILDEGGNDVTEEVLAYMGPNEDFHGQTTTPGDLGYKALLFQLRSGKEEGFDREEAIRVGSQEKNK